MTVPSRPHLAAVAVAVFSFGCTTIVSPQTPATSGPAPSPVRPIVEIENNGPAGIRRPPVSVVIIDQSGQLFAAREATNAELAAVVQPNDEPIYVGSVSSDRTMLGVVWYGTICDRTAALTISPADHILVIEGPREPCDLAAIGRGVVLTFARPLSSTLVTPELRTPEPSGG